MHQRALQYRRPLAARCDVPVFGRKPNVYKMLTSLDRQTLQGTELMLWSEVY
jgi:hypothetical protein